MVLVIPGIGGWKALLSQETKAGIATTQEAIGFNFEFSVCIMIGQH